MMGLAAEKMFSEAVMDAKRLIKHKPCNRIPPRVIEKRCIDMTPNEVIEILKEHGINISRRTLLNYENWGLIPQSKRGGLGQGKGRTTDYPDITPAEAYASYKILHAKALTPTHQYLSEVLRLYRNNKSDTTVSNDKESIYLFWFVDFVYANYLITFKPSVEKLTGIKAHLFEIAFPAMRDGEIKLGSPEMKTIKHGDVKISIMGMGKEKPLVEYWDDEHKKYIKVDMD